VVFVLAIVDTRPVSIWQSWAYFLIFSRSGLGGLPVIIGSSGSEPRRPLGMLDCFWWMVMISGVFVTVRLALSRWTGCW